MSFSSFPSFADDAILWFAQVDAFFPSSQNFARAAIAFIVLWHVHSTCTHYHIQVSLFQQYLLRPVSFGLTCVMLLLIGLAFALNVIALKICINLDRLFLVLA